MASIFDAYDEEFLALTQDIGNNIDHVNNFETELGQILSFGCIVFRTLSPSISCSVLSTTTVTYVQQNVPTLVCFHLWFDFFCLTEKSKRVWTAESTLF